MSGMGDGGSDFDAGGHNSSGDSNYDVSQDADDYSSHGADDYPAQDAGHDTFQDSDVAHPSMTHDVSSDVSVDGSHLSASQTDDAVSGSGSDSDPTGGTDIGGSGENLFSASPDSIANLSDHGVLADDSRGAAQDIEDNLNAEVGAAVSPDSSGNLSDHSVLAGDPLGAAQCIEGNLGAVVGAAASVAVLTGVQYIHAGPMAVVGAAGAGLITLGVGMGGVAWDCAEKNGF